METAGGRGAKGDSKPSPAGVSEKSKLKAEPRPTVEDIGDEYITLGAGAAAGKEVDKEEDPDKLNLGAAVAGISSWFSSTFSTAKEKSSEMYEYLKEDFSELSHSVSEASKDLKDKLHIDDQTFKSAVDSVTSTASLVLDQMSTIFGVGPDDDDEAITVGGAASGGAKIYSLATKEEVFLKDPEDIKSYEAWLLTFDLDQKKCEMDDLLSANPHLHLHHSHLVPEKVSHLVFWHRFYYRVHEIQVAELENKELRKKHEAKARKKSGGVEDDDNEKDEIFIDADDDSSSLGSFAVVTHDAATKELKID
ncbi:BSD domain-containing protein 1 [Orchesella cincta]|uniref:BSD domain-containing protein 1 n=1 Tax=Orchesella cincta TaxID=48709 RepID=A0A1D2MFK3_ORCCI|nr:BSD domain-containing protein 1 [Orchesella cincta]